MMISLTHFIFVSILADLYFWQTVFSIFLFVTFLLFSCKILLNELKVIPNTFVYVFTHLLPDCRSKLIIFFLRKRVVKTNTGLNSITVGYMLQKYSSCSGSFFRRNSKTATIVSKHLSSFTNQFW